MIFFANYFRLFEQLDKYYSNSSSMKLLFHKRLINITVLLLLLLSHNLLHVRNCNTKHIAVLNLLNRAVLTVST